ncbi:MAG: hypothetical protein Crog4KO_31930 [Crocinitomicaceae bacterium]
MKKYYLTILAAITVSFCQVNAQIATKIYDHDSTDLTQLFNMPFDENRMLVVAGFDSYASKSTLFEYDFQNNQLNEMNFTGVDTIYGLPKLHEDKIFFASHISGLGVELTAYNGSNTFTFDFNTGAGSSNPELVNFEDDLYVIANDGSYDQLYKYMGGTSFMQISEETQGDVAQFIANRGDEYIYSVNMPMVKHIKSTIDNNGTLTHSMIVPTNLQESVEDVVLLNGDIFLLSAMYSFVDAAYRVDMIDASSTISTNYYETGGQFSSAHLLAHNSSLLYYRTESNHIEVLDLTTSGQPAQYLTMDPSQYNYITGHVVKNGKLFFYADTYIVEVSAGIFNFALEDGNLIQLTTIYETDDALYFYEVHPNLGNNSGVIEIDVNSNAMMRHTASQEGGYMYLNHPMVENNGELKFIFSNFENTLSSDIYSFSPSLSLPESEEATLLVYPNPSLNGDVLIELLHPDQIVITSMEGKTVEIIQGFEGKNLLQLKEPGVYMVHANGKSQKVIVQ